MITNHCHAKKKSRVAHQKPMPKTPTRNYCEESRTQPEYHVILGCGYFEQVQDAPAMGGGQVLCSAATAPAEAVKCAHAEWGRGGLLLSGPRDPH